MKKLPQYIIELAKMLKLDLSKIWDEVSNFTDTVFQQLTDDSESDRESMMKILLYIAQFLSLCQEMSEDYNLPLYTMVKQVFLMKMEMDKKYEFTH